MQNYGYFSVLSLLVALTPQSLVAQTATGCTRSDVTNPPRIEYQCVGGIILEAEAAAALGFLREDADGRPTVVELLSRGALIEVTPRSGAFQIRTPHAIAAVRGTEYVVDVTAASTAIFVSQGAVTVSRADGSEPVVLTDGLGVDVTPGQPLVVRRWPQDRVDGLLSRFGR